VSQRGSVRTLWLRHQRSQSRNGHVGKHYAELTASYVEGGKFKKEEYSKHQAAK